MPETWVDIAAGDVDANSPSTYTLFQKLEQRDRALAQSTAQLYFTEVSAAGIVYPTFSSVLIEAPVVICPSTVVVSLVIEGKVDAGTGYARATINAIAATADASFTGTGYGAVSFLWSDLSALRGELATLRLLVSNSAAPNTTYIRSINRIQFTQKFS